jgi:hypothetical protein
MQSRLASTYAPRFAELRDALSVGPRDSTQAVMMDGLKIQLGRTLDADQINAVVVVAEGLLVRPAELFHNSE